MWDLGRQLPDYYHGQSPRKMGPMLRKLESDAKERFLAMDLFFVKVWLLPLRRPTQ